MVCVDKDGNPLGPPEDIPEPDSVTNGLAAIPAYVARFIGSTAPFASLSVLTADGSRGCGLTRRDGKMQIFFPVDWRRQPEQEHRLREFFAQRSIAPVHDYLAGNGGVPDATRILMYPLPNSPESVAALCSDLLDSCFGVTSEETLQFREPNYTS